MPNVETITIDGKLINKIESVTKVAIEYESLTKGRRKLGITAEVGEVLACHELDLKLVADPRSKGFDAIDKQGKRVQIKSRRSESERLPSDKGRTSRFSKHKFDYALLVLLDRRYKLCEIWQTSYDKLKPIIERQKRRDPNLSSFKRAGKNIWKI